MVGHVPEVISAPTCVTVTLLSQASDAEGIGHEGVAGQSMVVLAAQVMVGAVISRTVTDLWMVAVLPQSSVATYLRV